MFLSILAVLLILLVIYLLNIPPLPPNTTNPIKYTIFVLLTKILDDVARVKAWWSGRDYRLVFQEMMLSSTLKSRQSHPDVKVTEDTFDGVHVFIYQRHGTRKNRPGLVFYHGGGLMFGHPAGDEGLFKRLLKQFDIVIAAPRYRLSPTFKAPVQHEDCKTATNYFFKNAERFGVDPKCIGSVGDSAGGNLAASMCLMMRDQGLHKFAFQVLIYPWTQGIDNNSPSRQRNYPTAFRVMARESLTRMLGSVLGADPKEFDDLAANKHVDAATWEKYKSFLDIKDIPDGSIPPTYQPFKPTHVNEKLAEKIKDDLINIFPLCAKSLTDLPPALVITVENDPIRDDGIWYAKRLQREGVKVTHFHSKGGFHAMIGLLDPPLAFDSGLEAYDRIEAFIGEYVKAN